MKILTLFDIDESEFTWGQAKSSGAGGQHVNTTNSQVQLRWNVDKSNIAIYFKDLLKVKLKNKLNTQNEIIISSQLTRSQHRNKEDCLKKFKETLEKACYKPKPRKKTKPKKGAIEKRLKDKKKSSDKKRMRQKGHDYWVLFQTTRFT